MQITHMMSASINFQETEQWEGYSATRGTGNNQQEKNIVATQFRSAREPDQGTGTATRTPTTMDETTKASITDLTTTSHWALVTTGLIILVNGLLNAGTLNTRFHRILQLSLTRCLGSSVPFSFIFGAVWTECARLSPTTVSLCCPLAMSGTSRYALPSPSRPFRFNASSTFLLKTSFITSFAALHPPCVLLMKAFGIPASHVLNVPPASALEVSWSSGGGGEASQVRYLGLLWKPGAAA